MFNVRINFSKLLLLPLGLIILSCGNRESEAEAVEKANAGDLVQQINDLLEMRAYNRAIDLIDSLNTAYPNEIELRKTTLLSRARAMEGLIRDSIPLVDAMLSTAELRVDSLGKFFVTVTEKGFTPYLVDKAVRNSLANTNAVQPRVSKDDNAMSLVVKVAGNIDIKAISANISGEDIWIDIRDAGNRRANGAYYQMISINEHELEPLLVALDYNSPTTVSIIGEKGNAKIKLSKTDLTAIRRSIELAREAENVRKARVKRELLERKLIVAQNQVANFEK